MRKIWATPDAEATIAYIARVSSEHQDSPEYEKLIRYLIKHRHWSPFEMASLCVEIETSRAIAQQILRHRSFSFQEFSQRYAVAVGIEPIELRVRGTTNRQSSLPAPHVTEAWATRIAAVTDMSRLLYRDMVQAGIAAETARMVLPLATKTRLYMAGTIRSWIHYIELRTSEDTQQEHREVALGAQAIFVAELPTVSKALGWTS